MVSLVCRANKYNSNNINIVAWGVAAGVDFIYLEFYLNGILFKWILGVLKRQNSEFAGVGNKRHFKNACYLMSAVCLLCHKYDTSSCNTLHTN